MDLLSGWQIAGGLILLIAGLIWLVVWLSGGKGEAKAESSMQAKIAKEIYEDAKSVTDKYRHAAELKGQPDVPHGALADGFRKLRDKGRKG